MQKHVLRILGCIFLQIGIGAIIFYEATIDEADRTRQWSYWFSGMILYIVLSLVMVAFILNNEEAEFEKPLLFPHSAAMQWAQRDSINL